MSDKETIDLLKQLIAIPSFSKEEDKKATFLAEYLQQKGCEVKRVGNNVYCLSDHFDENKKTLLLNSHIDTVKNSAAWTYNPFEAAEEGDKIYGLGANDALASVVSLINVFLALKSEALPYNLVLGISCEEEISGKGGMELLYKALPQIDLALVGEPTGMQMAVAEKGLMVLDCVAKGVSGHAAREEGVNAIYEAMKDIAWFKDYQFERVSSFLGKEKMSVTMINAGYQHNVVPDACSFTVDVRVTDAYTLEEVLEEIKAHVSCSVTPRSVRLRSSRIDLNHPLVKIYQQMGGRIFGSSTLSDQALIPCESVKMGPGDSARSHTANEFIKPSEIIEAIQTYKTLLRQLDF